MQIISRTEAATRQQKRFFTGKSCVHGHVSERYVTTGACIDCLRAVVTGTTKLTFYVDDRDVAAVTAHVDAVRIAREAYDASPQAQDEKAYWRMIENFRKGGCPATELGKFRTYGTFTLPEGREP